MVDDWMNHRCAPDAPPANPDCPDGMEDEVPAVKAKPKKFQLPLRGSAGRSASCVDPNNLALNLSTKCSSTTAESDSAFNSSPPLNNNNNSMKNGTAAGEDIHSTVPIGYSDLGYSGRAAYSNLKPCDGPPLQHKLQPYL